jgi:hypothetical protein
MHCQCPLNDPSHSIGKRRLAGERAADYKDRPLSGPRQTPLLAKGTGIMLNTFLRFSTRRPLWPTLAISIGIAAILAGAPSSDSHAESRQTIRMVGSSTMYRMSSHVAEAFGHNSAHATPVVESTGTGTIHTLRLRTIDPLACRLVPTARSRRKRDSRCIANNDQ